jgi:hypothetical protein
MKKLLTIFLIITSLSVHAQIRTDYKDHFLIGTFIGMTGVCVDLQREKPILSATAAGFIVGTFKEVVYDLTMEQGTFEWQDIFFTTAGAFVTGVVVKSFIRVSDKLVMTYGYTGQRPFDYGYRPPTDRKTKPGS